MRRVLSVITLTAALTAAGVATASAAPTGPECDPGIVTAVLVVTAGRVVPGGVIQYLEVGNSRLILCTVTVQSQP